MTIAEVSSASPSSIVTVSTAVMAPLAGSVILDMGSHSQTVGSQARTVFQHRSGHLHVGVVDLDTLIHQTKIRIWYTLGTQDVRKRPTAANARLDQMA
jgi:hypothetical protein